MAKWVERIGVGSTRPAGVQRASPYETLSITTPALISSGDGRVASSEVLGGKTLDKNHQPYKLLYPLFATTANPPTYVSQ